MLKRVLEIAADVFQVPEGELGATSTPEMVSSWDSLHHLNFVLALEQEFSVQFTPEEIEQLVSLEITAAVVEEKLKACQISHGA